MLHFSPGGRLAGKSTLNRLEHAAKIGRDRHHKLDHDAEAIEQLFVDIFPGAHDRPPPRIVIDLDATDDPVYGEQKGRHFHGYYDGYCYLPLYVFCGRRLLAAKLRYEDVYCQRGEMENRLKECQGDLFADRTPAPTVRANQLRLWLASFAYVLMCAVRRIGVAGTKLAVATCGTIGLKLLKIGALITISVRRVKFAFASACPDREVFMLAARRL